MWKECTVNIDVDLLLTSIVEDENITFIPALHLHKPVFRDHSKLKNNTKNSSERHLKPVEETSTVTPERQTKISQSIKRKNNALAKVQKREVHVCKGREKMLANREYKLPKQMKAEVFRQLADVSNRKLNDAENLKSKRNKSNVLGTYRLEEDSTVTKVMTSKSNCVEHETVIGGQGRVDENKCSEILGVYKLPEPITIKQLVMLGKEYNSDVESDTEYGTDARQEVFEKTVSIVKYVTSTQQTDTNTDFTQEKHNNYQCNTEFSKASSSCKGSTQSKYEINGNNTEQVSSSKESKQNKALVSIEFPVNMPLKKSNRAKKHKYQMEDSDMDLLEPVKKACTNRKVNPNKREAGISGRNLNRNYVERTQDHTEKIPEPPIKHSVGKVMGSSEDLRLRSTRQRKINYNEDSDYLQLRRSTRQCKISYNEDYDNQFDKSSSWLRPSSKKVKQAAGIRRGRNLSIKGRTQDHTEEIPKPPVKHSFRKVMESGENLQLRRSSRQCKISYNEDYDNQFDKSSSWLRPSSKKVKQEAGIRRGRNLSIKGRTQDHTEEIPKPPVKHSFRKVMESGENLQLRRSTRQRKINYKYSAYLFDDSSSSLDSSSKKTKQGKIKDKSLNTRKVEESGIRISAQKQNSEEIGGSDNKEFNDEKLQMSAEVKLKCCLVRMNSLRKENHVNEEKQGKERERGSAEKEKNTGGKGKELGKDSERGRTRNTKNTSKKREEKQGKDSERGSREREKSSKEGEEKQDEDSERSSRGKTKGTSKETLKKSAQQTKSSKKPGEKKQAEVPQSSEDCKITAKKGTLKYLQQREKYVAALAREAREDDDFCSSNPIFAKKFKFTNLLPLSHEETLVIKTPERGTNEDWKNRVITPRTVMLGQLQPLTPTTQPYSPCPTLDSNTKKDALKQVYQVMKSKGHRPRRFRKVLQETTWKNINFTPLELPALPGNQSGNESETAPDEYFSDSDTL